MGILLPHDIGFLPYKLFGSEAVHLTWLTVSHVRRFRPLTSNIRLTRIRVGGEGSKSRGLERELGGTPRRTWSFETLGSLGISFMFFLASNGRVAMGRRKPITQKVRRKGGWREGHKYQRLTWNRFLKQAKRIVHEEREARWLKHGKKNSLQK